MADMADMAVDTGEVVDLVAIGDGVMVMVVDFIIPGDGDGVGDMVTDTGVAIIHIIRIIHIMGIPPMGKEIPIVPVEAGPEMAMTEHHLQDLVADTALPQWEGQQLGLMTG